MHGRLKIKTTAEQEEEKRKEREIKKKKYLAGLNVVFTKRKENVNDKEGLNVAANLLCANPDALSLWNYRREVLLEFKKELEEEEWQNILLDELKTTEYCLVKNPKSYGAWHHRDWVFRVIPNPPYKEELELCDRYFQKDERNFHCWDHRRIIVRRSNRSLSEELAFTQNLIEKNFSNYSAWHYRSKLLPIIYPPTDDSPHPIPEDIFIKELNKVVTAVFTDPSDQSPWFFLRWLLGGKMKKERLVQICIVPGSDEDEVEVLFVFSTAVESCDNLIVMVNETLIPNERLRPQTQNSLWVLPIPRSEQLHLQIKFKDSDETLSIDTEVKDLPQVKRFSKDLFSRGEISDKAQKSISDIMKNCVILDELEPGNKWVLLTLVHMMSMVHLKDNLEKIVSYLDQLQSIDPLRVNYYRDLRSRILMEEKLLRGIEPEHFDASDLSLSHIVHPQYLSGVKKINLKGNEISSLHPASVFLNCSNLILDGNPIRDISPLSNLRRLEELSLNSCGIDSMKIIEDLRNVKSLTVLSIKDNPINEERESLETDIKLMVESLREIKL